MTFSSDCKLPGFCQFMLHLCSLHSTYFYGPNNNKKLISLFCLLKIITDGESAVIKQCRFSPEIRVTVSVLGKYIVDLRSFHKYLLFVQFKGKINVSSYFKRRAHKLVLGSHPRPDTRL